MELRWWHVPIFGHVSQSDRVQCTRSIGPNLDPPFFFFFFSFFNTYVHKLPILLLNFLIPFLPFFDQLQCFIHWNKYHTSLKNLNFFLFKQIYLIFTIDYYWLWQQIHNNNLTLYDLGSSKPIMAAKMLLHIQFP